MYKPNEDTPISHRIAVGLWHSLCTFLTLGLLTLLWGSPFTFQMTLVVAFMLSTISFILGYLGIQDPVMWFYSSAFKLIR